MSKQHRPLALISIFLPVFLLTVSTTLADSETRPETSSGRVFLRYVESEQGEQLQTSIVSYRNSKGQIVHLVGAVHVGEKTYYKGLRETWPAKARHREFPRVRRTSIGQGTQASGLRSLATSCRSSGQRNVHRSAVSAPTVEDLGPMR